MSQCTAKSKRSGERCKRHASIGMNVCAIHGGKTPSGLANPNLKHGRYSKDLPTRLAARYEHAASDPDLLRLDSEIHLLGTLISERLATLDTGESGRIWRELRESWKQYMVARSARPPDTAGMSDALDRVAELIQRGSADHGARQEIADLIERRRKLVDSEGKRRVQMQQVMTIEQATLLVSVVANSVRRHVDSPEARAAIARDIAAVFSGGPDGDHQP